MIIFHKLFYLFVYLLKCLPWFILYGISNFIYYILYYIVGYRKEVVYENLTNSFPDKSKQEIKKIAKHYFRHMSDILVEAICEEKMVAHYQKHMSIKNPEILEKLYATGKSVLLIGGHLGNWEWLGVTMEKLSPFNAKGVIKPLSNPFFNNYIEAIRSRNSSGIIPFKQTIRVMISNRNKQFLYMLAADQTPHRDEIRYWIDFLHQPTPVFQGTEKIAKTLDMPVVFTNLYRVKRGVYEMELTLITDTPKLCVENEITEKHVALLEKIILERPYNWLWSHKRWKYRDEYPKYLLEQANKHE